MIETVFDRAGITEEVNTTVLWKEEKRLN
jgi:hypothetical protein